jgi:hypothetical protein
MRLHSPLITPLVGAQFDPVTGEHKANVAEERFIDRGGRWWMRQARLYAEQLAKPVTGSEFRGQSGGNTDTAREDSRPTTHQFGASHEVETLPHPGPLPPALRAGEGEISLGTCSQGGTAFALGYSSLAPSGLQIEPNPRLGKEQ